MEITPLSVKETIEAVRAGIGEGHPAPYEGLFNSRRAAYDAFAAGLGTRDGPIYALGCFDNGSIKSAAVWLDPSTEGPALGIAASKALGLFARGPEEERAYYLVKVLDAMLARLRRSEREYLTVEANPGDELLVHVLEGSNFLLIAAEDVFGGPCRPSLKAGFAAERAENDKDFAEFVSTAVPPAVDPYLGDFAVRARRILFVEAAARGTAYYAKEKGNRVGVITLETVPGLPPATVSVGLAHPWDDPRVYAAALAADSGAVIVRAPLAAVGLRAELAGTGFRPCDVRLTYRMLL